MNDEFWKYSGLFLNILFMIISLYIAVIDIVGSIFHTIVGLIALALILLAISYRKRLVILLHSGVMMVFMLSALYFINNSAGWPWYADMVLHFFGGFFASLYFLSWFGNERPLWLLLVAGFLFGVSIGVFWEFLEWAGHQFTNNPGFAIVASDTLSDLLCDTLGAVTSTLLFSIFLRKNI